LSFVAVTPLTTTDPIDNLGLGKMMGGKAAGDYLIAVGDGELDKDLPDSRIWKLHETFFPDVAEQMNIMSILKPNEKRKDELEMSVSSSGSMRARTVAPS